MSSEGFGLRIDRALAQRLRVFGPDWDESPAHHSQGSLSCVAVGDDDRPHGGRGDVERRCDFQGNVGQPEAEGLSDSLLVRSAVIASAHAASSCNRKYRPASAYVIQI